MTKKRSKSSTLNEIAEPPLCNSYRAALSVTVSPTYNFIKIPKKVHPKFMARQKQLDDAGVAYDVYAYTVVKSWWDWCQSKGMRTVPVNIFCGPKAWKKFISSYVRLDTAMDMNWNTTLHAEMCAARVYVGRNSSGQMISLREARKMFGSPQPSADVVTEVLGLLNQVYDTECENYAALAHHIITMRRTHIRMRPLDISGVLRKMKEARDARSV